MVKKNKGTVFIVSMVSIGVVLSLAIMGIFIFRDQPNYTKLNKDQAAIKLNSDEDFLLVLSRDWCVYCQQYKENTLKTYKGDLPVYILEVVPEFFDRHNPTYGNQGQRLEDQEEFLSFLMDNGLEELAVWILKENGGIFPSPTTVLIRKGELVSFTSGYMTKEKLDQFLRENR